MATDAIEAVAEDEAIVPVEDFLPEDAVVLYRKPESAIEDLTWNPEAAVAAVKGMPLALTDDRGQRKPCLYYDIPYGGRDGSSTHVRGPSAPLMRALVAQRGNFETVSVEVAQGVQIVPEVINDQRIVHQFPAIRATVRVRDLANNNVTTGVVTEPLFGQRKGGGLFAIPQAEANAISKATRNARAEHFAPILPLLMQVLVHEYERGENLVRGELPEAIITGALEAKRERAGRENQDLVKVGVIGANAFFAEIEALKSKLDEKQWKALSQDWQQNQPILCAGVKLQDAPQAALDRCRRWLEDKRKELGVADTPETPPAAYSADGSPKAEFTPSAKELIAFLKTLDDDTRNAAYTAAGADPEKPMTDDQRKTAWAYAHEAVEGDGRIQGSLLS